jgi:hypothetical protein
MGLVAGFCDDNKPLGSASVAILFISLIFFSAWGKSCTMGGVVSYIMSVNNNY